jgi:hypothetical protein
MKQMSLVQIFLFHFLSLMRTCQKIISISNLIFFIKSGEREKIALKVKTRVRPSMHLIQSKPHEPK